MVVAGLMKGIWLSVLGLFILLPLWQAAKWNWAGLKSIPPTNSDPDNKPDVPRD